MGTLVGIFAGTGQKLVGTFAAHLAGTSLKIVGDFVGMRGALLESARRDVQTPSQRRPKVAQKWSKRCPNEVQRMFESGPTEPQIGSSSDPDVVR